jgi:hypothetical protein
MKHRFVIQVALLALFVSAPLSFADAQAGYGQVVLQNDMSVTVDLTVDDHYGCRALAHLTCTTQERTGYHVLHAAASDGRSSDKVLENLGQGEVYTYRVWEE